MAAHSAVDAAESPAPHALLLPPGYVGPMQRVENATRAQRDAKRRQRADGDAFEAQWGVEGAAHLRAIALLRRDGAQYRPRRVAATKRDLEDVRALGSDDSEDDVAAVATAAVPHPPQQEQSDLDAVMNDLEAELT